MKKWLADVKPVRDLQNEKLVWLSTPSHYPQTDRESPMKSALISLLLAGCCC